ncbi:MAG: NAD(P)H-dependent glycerol-3-phosphate dehydrogenase [Pseudomonadota bacterium]
MKEQYRILILGYGEMGKAMEYLLRKQHPLDIWEKFPQDNFQSAILEDVVPHADIVFFCLPVNPHQGIVKNIAPLLKSTCLCVSIAKGLDEKGQTAAQIFAENLASHQPYALLYGPMISEEIRADRYAFAQLGCCDMTPYHILRHNFEDTHLYIEYTPDITGISWSVILKNVYALVFGMADALQLGNNMRGYLAVTALHELNKIVCHLGGHSGSAYQLAGLGDLITTATSDDSHHHELGRRLARGETQDITGEGIHTLEMVHKYQLFSIVDYPLFRLIYDIVNQPQNVAQKINTHLKHRFDHVTAS